MPNNNNNSNGIGLGMLQGAFSQLGAGQQYRRQRRLMDLQHQNQRELNQQGHQLQMDMWNQTNYGAQVEHMKKAGLSPGLMYGTGGGGGTTAGSQGGGSASGGNAVQMHPMDMANLSLIKAQKDKIYEEIEKSKFDRGDKGRQDIAESVSREEMNNIKRDLDSQSYKYLDERDMSRESFGAVKALKEMTGANYGRIFKAVDDRIGDMLDVYDNPGKAIKDKANKIKEVLDEAVLGHGLLFKGLMKGLKNWNNKREK